jgi:hypothetical protein
VSTGQTNTEKRLLAARGNVERAFPFDRRDHKLWEYPLDVEELVRLELFKLSVAVEFRSVKGLTTSTARALLRDIGAAAAPSVVDAPLLGFLWSSTSRVVIFTNPDRGEASERFTRAHEAGHLIVELLDRYRRARQASLFDAPAPVSEVHDDPRENFVGGDVDERDGTEADSFRARVRALRARADASLRETIANSTGIELLAPLDLVREMGRDGRDGLVDRLMERFGISRTAANLRVGEVFASREPMQPRSNRRTG